MAARNTNNSLQATLFPGTSDAGPPTSVPTSVVPTLGSLAQTPGGSSVPINSTATSPMVTPELVALIAQTVQTAMAAERARDREQVVVPQAEQQGLPSSEPNVGLGAFPMH
ncbi:hypothetical protein OS493_017590 [Desmophyllum pertusum]|uniref:Uncharacterized protein n=1 Tax=Desmophyllum pertusum TaxID=174260 RepID=A0A9X0D3I3_9CNID|nr:hypothetical protein OS493_017590 [Desmophyllum pertusum]